METFHGIFTVYNHFMDFIPMESHLFNYLVLVETGYVVF